jgi:hypothetical protein
VGVGEGAPTGAGPTRRRADHSERRRAGLLTILARALHAGLDLGVLEGVTLFLAASAYLAYALAHHRNRRELVTRSILVSAFALWGIVQLAPGVSGAALLNDIAILLFVTDLAVLLSPWT